MSTMDKLTKRIVRKYEEDELTPKIKTIAYLEPIVKLSKNQLNQLNEGDGQAKNQYKQVNSSTGLAVNYFKLLERTGTIKNLIFENKVAKPLKTGGRYANLDVSYIQNSNRIFIESKFLEPYYSGNEKNSDSYMNGKKYNSQIGESIISKWIELFKEAQEYTYYNFSQLCRHLLAIYKYTHQLVEDSDYNGEPVCLKSVVWYMTDNYLDSITDEKEKTELRERLSILKEEAKSCQKRINQFIKDINWANMTFEAVSYNDILKDIENTGEFYEKFKKRYFFND